MTEDEIRAALAEVLQGASSLGCEEFDPNDPDSGCPDCGDLLRATNALLPTVRRIVAEQLRAMGKARTTVSKLTPVESLTCFIVKLEDLFRRADALDPR